MYPIIRLTQEDPYERGLEYGRQAREKIEICVEYYKKQFLKKGMLWEVLKKIYKQIFGNNYRDLSGTNRRNTGNISRFSDTFRGNIDH